MSVPTLADALGAVSSGRDGNGGTGLPKYNLHNLCGRRAACSERNLHTSPCFLRQFCMSTKEAWRICHTRSFLVACFIVFPFEQILSYLASKPAPTPYTCMLTFHSDPS